MFKNLIYNYILIIFLIFLVIIDSGNCINCYSCNDVGSPLPNCSSEFKPGRAETIDCSNDNICQKVINPTIGGYFEPITRGCYDRTLCTELSHCFNCTYDLCNSTTGTTPFLTITIGILLALILIFTS